MRTQVRGSYRGRVPILDRCLIAMAKVAIFGATGRLGSFAVHTISYIPHVSEILLLGRSGREEYLDGLTKDFMECFAARGTNISIGWSTDLADARDAAIVVCTAGVARQPGQSRLDLAMENARVVAPFAREIGRIALDSFLLMVTNPVDVMTALALQYSGMRRSRVFGLGTHLDSMRLKALLAEKLQVHVSEVHTRIVGEHGESMVPLWSATSIGGIALNNLMIDRVLDREEIMQIVKNSGEAIIRKKGFTVYGPGEAIATLVRAILGNENRILTVSSHMDGEIKGISGVCIGTPARLNRAGVTPVPIWMNDAELKAFVESAEKIKYFTREILEKLGRDLRPSE